MYDFLFVIFIRTSNIMELPLYTENGASLYLNLIKEKWRRNEEVEKESSLFGNSTTFAAGDIQKRFNISYIWDRQQYVGIEARSSDYRSSNQSHLKKIIHSNGC